MPNTQQLATMRYIQEGFRVSILLDYPIGPLLETLPAMVSGGMEMGLANSSQILLPEAGVAIRLSRVTIVEHFRRAKNRKKKNDLNHEQLVDILYIYIYIASKLSYQTQFKMGKGMPRLVTHAKLEIYKT